MKMQFTSLGHFRVKSFLALYFLNVSRARMKGVGPDPPRCPPPGSSLREAGLARDVHGNGLQSLNPSGPVGEGNRGQGPLLQHQTNSLAKGYFPEVWEVPLISSRCIRQPHLVLK
jgi:hypothetical protein